MFKSYINPEENEEAKQKLPRLMVEGLLMGGAGLGVLALIFEIAADAFSVAAYQTLLAIHGAEGYHEVAIGAFILLSILLFLGIVPAYKAGAYLRPNAGGSGPLVEAIGPTKLRKLSWIGTSLFFIDAILTIIISSISAADVTMLVLPELAPYRIWLAEFFAFFIMSVLVAIGPKRAVPLFLLGGGAFTLFTIGALTLVGVTSALYPEWAFLTEGIVLRLQASGVVEEVVRARQELTAISSVIVFQLFFRSMSSAMLGFSGYEVIPASGKHAARPKWKVINTALTLAAIFLITTGIIQLFAARQWNIPATEGYSTLLIEYEIDAVQVMTEGIDPNDIVVTEEDVLAATLLVEERIEEEGVAFLEEAPPGTTEEDIIAATAFNVAVSREITDVLADTTGATFLFIAGTLLSIILLLAQGGGYIGGSAVAANAARLGRLPSFFNDDRIGIAVIWAISAMMIPFIREVVVVEAYYAFGFVSAFVITSTTVYFVRNDIMEERGIMPGSDEAKSLRFAGLRGMIASYFMMLVLITQKTEALPAIITAGAIITVFQILYANGGFKRTTKVEVPAYPVGTRAPHYDNGVTRAHDQARQRGIADAIDELMHSGAFAKFNVGPERIIELVCYLQNVDSDLFYHGFDHEHDKVEEPSQELDITYREALAGKLELARLIEDYSHFGIFMFINNYHINWVDLERGRDAATVQQAMLDILFPLTDHDVIWKEYVEFEPAYQPEPIWQFSSRRYLWAKDQWPNLSDRITTIWTLQDFGLVPQDIDVQTIISVADGRQQMLVKIPTSKVEDEAEDDETENKE